METDERDSKWWTLRCSETLIHVRSYCCHASFHGHHVPVWQSPGFVWVVVVMVTDGSGTPLRLAPASQGEGEDKASIIFNLTKRCILRVLNKSFYLSAIRRSHCARVSFCTWIIWPLSAGTHQWLIRLAPCPTLALALPNPKHDSKTAWRHRAFVI